MSNSTILLLATNNRKKLAELQHALRDYPNIKITTPDACGITTEPEETGTTFEENARLKAEYYAKLSGLISLSDDSGLIVDALEGRPGVYSARYAPTDAERIAKLLDELNGVQTSERTARFASAMCLASPEAVIAEEIGFLEGSISTAEKGNDGFGYDPIFIIQNSDKHLAELSSDEKNAISHRGNALRKIIPAIINSLTN